MSNDLTQPGTTTPAPPAASRSRRMFLGGAAAAGLALAGTSLLDALNAPLLSLSAFI